MRLPLILTAILTISMTAVVVLLPSLDSNVNAIIIANTTDFSVNVLDNWAYFNAKFSDGGDYNSTIFLVPTEYGDFFNSNADFQKSLQKVGAISLITLDSIYPFENVPLEVYARYHNQSEDKILSKENTTIDGEKALKIHKTFKDINSNFTEGINYYIFHDGNPYKLEYSATVKDFQKYLPQFEQMVKTFKFAK